MLCCTEGGHRGVAALGKLPMDTLVTPRFTVPSLNIRDPKACTPHHYSIVVPCAAGVTLVVGIVRLGVFSSLLSVRGSRWSKYSDADQPV